LEFYFKIYFLQASRPLKLSLIARILLDTHHIARALGKDASNRSIISSTAFALISFFYIYTMGSYFKISTYILENRVIYTKLFDNYIISKNVDHIIVSFGMILWLSLSLRGKTRFLASTIYGGLTMIAILFSLDILLDFMTLISIPLLIAFLIYNRLSSKMILQNIHTNLAVNYLAIIGIAVGLVSLLISLAPLFSISNTTIPTPDYAYEIFSLVSSSSPILLLLLILCLPVKLLMNEFMAGILKIKNNNRFDSLLVNDSLKSRTKIIYILLFVLLSITITLIPHQPTINKDNQQIGVDTVSYVDWINILIQSNDVDEFIRQAFVIQSGDRPLALIFLFIIVDIMKIVNANFFYIIEYVPLVLGPALILVIYFLTRELTSNDITSLMASFLTAISFQTLIGIYAGFYANWFALIIGYLSFVFLIRFLKKPSKLNLIVYSMLIVLLLFTHVYTWTVLAIVMGIFLAVLLKFNYYSRKSIILLLLVISSSVVIDVARMTITGSSSGIVNDIAVARAGDAGIEQYKVRWSNLIEVTQIHLGGQFSNFLLFILGLYWLINCNLRQPSNILIAIFLSVGVIPLFFGDWIIQTRVFYDIPFQIPAAITLTYVKKQANGTIPLLAICTWLIAMSIRTVANFYLTLPS
jgi:hypothetical protein